MSICRGMSAARWTGTGTSRPSRKRESPAEVATHRSPRRSACSDRSRERPSGRRSVGVPVLDPENWINSSTVPTHRAPSDATSTPATRPMSVTCVTLCGVSRLTPSVVPTQMLPSRSSARPTTPSASSPVSAVARSVKITRPRSSSRTRHRPWPAVPTHRFCRRSRSSWRPRPRSRALSGAGSSSVRLKPTIWSVTLIAPLASSAIARGTSFSRARVAKRCVDSLNRCRPAAVPKRRCRPLLTYPADTGPSGNPRSGPHRSQRSPESRNRPAPVPAQRMPAASSSRVVTGDAGRPSCSPKRRAMP